MAALPAHKKVRHDSFSADTLPARGGRQCPRARRGKRADRVRPSREAVGWRADRVGRQGGRRDIGGRLRRHGRPRRRSQEGGRAQRHRAAARLGQLRRHHHGVRSQVRHQGQLASARRGQSGRDQRRHPAEGQVDRTRRFRSRPVGGAGQHRHVRAVQGGRRSTTSPTPTRIPMASGSTTMAATCRSATTRRRCPPSPASTTCSSPNSRARSRSTATRLRPAPRSPA